MIIPPIKVVFVPFESLGNHVNIKRNDLPRFKTTEEALEFMRTNPSIHTRLGKPVHLRWIEHTETWAIDEYLRGVGSKGWPLN